MALIDSHLLKTGELNQSTLYSMGAALLWAIANTGFKDRIKTMGPMTFAFAQETTVLGYSAILMLYNKKPLFTKNNSISKH